MDFRLTTDLNPLFNAKIKEQIKFALEERTERSHPFISGAIYAQQASDLIGGVLFEIQGKTLWIDSLWVDSKFQKQGIASRLLEELAAFGKKNNCEFLQLNTYFAQNFFKK